MTTPSYRNNSKPKGRGLALADVRTEHRKRMEANKRPTPEEFTAAFRELVPAVCERMSARDFCLIAGIPRGSYYKWLNCGHAPMLLTRRALLAIMRELVKP